MPKKSLASAAARALAAQRRTYSGGDRTVLRPCPFCSAEFGARALREHLPRCPKRLLKAILGRKQ